MNKTEFIARVAEHQDISKVEARQIVDKVIDEIVDVIKEHDSVYFTELGTFGVKFREAHESRNPATGETFMSKAYDGKPYAKFTSVAKAH